MDLQFLGTGGSQPIPLPTCECALCREARERGAPYTRTGYSIHLPALRGVIDASELLVYNLNRFRVSSVRRLFLTHWHPDHAGGLRALGMRDPPTRDGESPLAAKRRTAPTLVTTRAVYERVRETHGVVAYYVDEGFLRVHLLDEEPFVADGVRVEPIPYATEPGGSTDATGFLFAGDARLAVVADDAAALGADRLPDDLDALVYPAGRFPDEPPASGPPSHETVRERVASLDPDRAFLSHVGHQAGRSYDELRAAEDDTVRFAFDGSSVSVGD